MEIDSGNLSDTVLWNACVLALCGWCQPDGNSTNNLSCSICNRQVSRTDKPFNPISEHRFYCPWAQVESSPPAPNMSSLPPSSSSSSSSSAVMNDTALENYFPGWELTLNSLISLSTQFSAVKRQSLNTNVTTTTDDNAEETNFNAEEVFKKVKSLLDSTIVGVRRPLPVPDPDIANIHSAVSGSIPPTSYSYEGSKK